MIRIYMKVTNTIYATFSIGKYIGVLCEIYTTCLSHTLSCPDLDSYTQIFRNCIKIYTCPQLNAHWEKKQTHSTRLVIKKPTKTSVLGFVRETEFVGKSACPYMEAAEDWEGEGVRWEDWVKERELSRAVTEAGRNPGLQDNLAIWRCKSFDSFIQCWAWQKQYPGKTTLQFRLKQREEGHPVLQDIRLQKALVVLYAVLWLLR